MNKHIDPEPDRRYIIREKRGSTIDSATVIEATDRHVRLQWDHDGKKTWHRYEAFLPMPDTGTYTEFQILEQIERPREPRGRYSIE